MNRFQLQALKSKSEIAENFVKAATETYSEPRQTSKTKSPANIAVNKFRKTLHFRCQAEFRIRLCVQNSHAEVLCKKIC